MRAFALLAVIAACHKSTPSVPAGPAPALRPPNPDAKIVPPSPASCGPLDMAVGSPPSECGPKQLAGSSGVISRVWELGCQIASMRDDGSVAVATSDGQYATRGHTFAPLPRNATTRVFLYTADGPKVWLDDRCEAPPLTPLDPNSVTGLPDGRVIYWGSKGNSVHFLERLVSGSWRISPPVRGDAPGQVWAQAGRFTSSYFVEARGDAPVEFGYFDEPSGEMRPIRRGLRASGLQLVPGMTADEPPTAMYTDDKRRLVIEMPDPEAGYRRIDRKLQLHECPDGGPATSGRHPRGDFFRHENEVLFRTVAGGLFLAFTESEGRCTYKLVGVSLNDPFAIGHPPPAPPHWNIDAVVESAVLVVIPIERGEFGEPMHLPIPARTYSYTGPWQFHPYVDAKLVRLMIGSVVFDLDATKLDNAAPFARPWVAKPAVVAQRIPPTPTPPPAGAAPFPDLRTTIANPIEIVEGAKSTRDRKLPNTIPSSCAIIARSGTGIERQLVLHCDLARAIEPITATADGRLVFAQFSQRGSDPTVEIAPNGDVTLGAPAPRDTLVPPAPPGWMIYRDGATVFGTHYDRGNELLRGKIVNNQWEWSPAFASGRTPPSGNAYWLQIMHHDKGDPTLVYTTSPHELGDIHVRTPAGTIIDWPTWNKRNTGNYRIDDITAAERPKDALPFVAARIDNGIVVGIPDGDHYALHRIAGNAAFDAFPPAPNATCTETITEREREELYSPQLATIDRDVILAYLSTRIRERLRFSKIPNADCGWIIDRRTVSNELAIAKLAGTTATEIIRVPVEYNPSQGFHGSNLLVKVVGKTIHALATSYGITTYTRLVL